MNVTFIRPIRFIPFDIGGNISRTESDEIAKILNVSIITINEFQKSLSRKLIVKYRVTDKISLSIFSFGIGVFSIEDEDYVFDGMDSHYAIKYCELRRESHADILNFRASYSNVLGMIIDVFRREWRRNHKNPRISANRTWENNGLSYVMTVSFVNSCRKKQEYNNLSSNEKHSLLFLLQPSLAQKEDSSIINIIDDENSFNPYDIDISKIDAPEDYWVGDRAEVYASWASVIVVQNTIKQNYVEFIKSLEINLQSMWLYTYCLYKNLICSFNQKSCHPSYFKSLRNSYQRMYNEFLSGNDSSMPVYVYVIHKEMINSSGIETEKERLIEYLDFCFEEKEAIEREHQRKYSWLNEILLFLIAYADISTTLFSIIFDFLPTAAVVVFAIIALVILILGIFFIIKKN